MTAEDCLFCRIATGRLPADVVLETPTVLAFRDVTPVAPVHVLVVPRAHHADLAALSAAEPGTAVDLVAAAVEVARREGLAGGHRVVVNTGGDAGQTVFHLHLHVLGGRALGWPPG